tara:strand:+ start:1056 stop:2186 length:1131 start_codon:yes stop_codon:yes gene_type:complete
LWDNLKVLHIITSLGPGGAEGMLYRLILASKNSIEHSVICLNKGGKYVSLMQKANIEVLVLNLKIFSSYKGIIPILKYSKAKRKQGYQIVTSWLYHADLVAWFVKSLCGFKSLVWNIRYTRLQLGRSSFKNWLILKTLAILSKYKVDRIISCSKSAGELHKKIGYNKNIFRIIPNGYFLNKTQKFDKNLKKYDGLFKICFIARWHHQKDFETLFQALDLLKFNKISFQLTIAGNNTNVENKELIALLKKYKLNEFCLLRGEVDNVQSIYLNSHTSVLCSAYGEAFPNVLAESMLNFTPCISTNVGDAAIILDDVGTIVPIGDYKAIADALTENHRLLRDENDVYINNCLRGFDKIYSKYDIQDIAKNYQEVWKYLE